VSFLERFNPRASLKTRLLLAASVWTAIGGGLLSAGVHWIIASRSAVWIAALPVALLAGWLKGRFVLAPRADANTARILAAGNDRCVGGVFSWRGWGLAACMMVGGIVLRHSPIPRPWLGFVYSAVGAALLEASLGGWRTWRRFSRELSQPAASAAPSRSVRPGQARGRNR
jgi:hypothetical protein